MTANTKICAHVLFIDECTFTRKSISDTYNYRVGNRKPVRNAPTFVPSTFRAKCLAESCTVIWSSYLPTRLEGNSLVYARGVDRTIKPCSSTHHMLPTLRDTSPLHCGWVQDIWVVAAQLTGLHPICHVWTFSSGVIWRASSTTMVLWILLKTLLLGYSKLLTLWCFHQCATAKHWTEYVNFVDCKFEQFLWWETVLCLIPFSCIKWFSSSYRFLFSPSPVTYLGCGKYGECHIRTISEKSQIDQRKWVFFFFYLKKYEIKFLR